MKPLVIAVLLVVALPVSAEDVKPTKEYILSRITEYSQKYAVSEGLLTYIVEKESGYNPLAVGDTHLKCPRTGGYMRSRGIAQISDCFHDVSDSEAFDVDFSLDFIAKNVAEGRAAWWSTARAYKKLYPSLSL